MAYTVNTAAADLRGVAMEGLEYSASGLTLSFGAGLIEGRAIDATAAPAVTAAGATDIGFLVSEDGDGTYTVTMASADAADAAAALVEALAIDVPAGGVGVLAGTADNTTVLSLITISVRGKLSPVSADETITL
jgi:TctA family transporter